MENKTNIAPEKRHIVVQCNNFFKKTFFYIHKPRETNVRGIL